jgi:RNA polymerase sigma-70 factor (ECF subfamily)
MSETEIARLYRDHRGAILGYLLRRVTEPEDAADLLTEVFVVAVRRHEDIPPDDSARLWLYGVARRLLANHRRGVRRRDDAITRLGSALRTAAAAQHPPADELVVVRQQLALLSDDDREMLTLTAWDGLTPGEAAQVLGLKPATARARLFRARKRLQARLAETDAIAVSPPLLTAKR